MLLSSLGIALFATVVCFATTASVNEAVRPHHHRITKLEPYIIVNRTTTSTTQNLKVFSCQGLFSRNQATPVYVLNNANDLWWLQVTGGAEVRQMGTETEDDFVHKCLNQFPRYVNFNASLQQALIPLMVTIAGVLDAIPLEVGDAKEGATLAFDAVATFAGMSELEATAYVYDRWGTMTTGVAKLNPGWRWDSKIKDQFEPTLSGTPSTQLVDYTVKERLFTFFLANGCIPHTPEYALVARMLADKNNKWSRPVVVYGYDNSHPLFGGDLYEAETTCTSTHDMGQVASEGVTNLAYFSSEPAISTPLQQLPDPPLTYNASKIYLAMVVGDGDNVQYIQSSRSEWMKDRVHRCQLGGGAANKTACFPLVWSIQANLLHMSPAWLRWFYATAQSTNADWFSLPPSGDTYSYPSLIKNPVEKATFVARTERDCTLLNTSGSVSWEIAGSWKAAIEDYYPKYAEEGIVRAFFPVNVPYMIPVLDFKADESFKVLGGGATPAVLFKPQEWRGSDPSRCQTPLSPVFGNDQCATVAAMAARINGMKPGTSTHIYLTSDGGGHLDTLYNLVAQLGEHVEVVNQNQVAAMALAQHRQDKRTK